MEKEQAISIAKKLIQNKKTSLKPEEIEALKTLTAAPEKHWHYAAPEKYWYYVCASGEADSSGWVYLTEEEAKAVAYASDTGKWAAPKRKPRIGPFFIDLEHKRTRKPRGKE